LDVDIWYHPEYDIIATGEYDFVGPGDLMYYDLYVPDLGFQGWVKIEEIRKKGWKQVGAYDN